MDLKKKLIYALATGSILLYALTPAAYAATYTISGNGADSDNDITIEVEREVDIQQDNDADFDNDVDVEASTGDNAAEDNTGGDVSIDTGDASAKVTLNNSANVNEAQVDCCPGGDTEVLIEGNGADSDNEVDVDLESDIDIDQDNDADFDNDVDVEADTGDNAAEDNTGGSVTIKTGDAKGEVVVSNAANWNSAVVGGEGSEGGAVSLKILDNGADSDNDIDFEAESEVDIQQDNDADFDNDVDVEASTGDNAAEDNTGGDVEIDTGDATYDVVVDNLANFNQADADCGCPVEDITGKIAGNGADSDNEIEIDLEDDTDYDQDNDSDFDNDVDVEAETGDNEVEDNGGGALDDPSITTGNAGGEVAVSNSANVNSIGGELPELEVDADLLELLELLNDLLDGLLG